MSQGLPVIATTVGDLPWLVREGRDGLLVPHGDTPAMAAALTDLARNPDRFAAMGQEAEHRVRGLAAEFTAHRIAAAWQGLLRDMGLLA